jgi:hypothetical protein
MIWLLGVRKLAGRLLCEISYNSEVSQSLFTELFSFSPMGGKVCLNKSFPEHIRNKIASKPQYIEVLRNYQDRDYSGANRRYWCFPHFREELEEGESLTMDLERSVTPNRGSEIAIDNETIEDYVRFPDPKEYLVGFVCGQ